MFEGFRCGRWAQDIPETIDDSDIRSARPGDVGGDPVNPSDGIGRQFVHQDRSDEDRQGEMSGSPLTDGDETVTPNQASQPTCDDDEVMVDTQLTPMAQSVPSAADLLTDDAVTSNVSPTSGLSRRTLVQGTLGSIGILVGSLGAGGDLIQDPVLGNSPF